MRYVNALWIIVVVSFGTQPHGLTPMTRGSGVLFARVEQAGRVPAETGAPSCASGALVVDWLHARAPLGAGSSDPGNRHFPWSRCHRGLPVAGGRFRGRDGRLDQGSAGPQRRLFW